MTLISIEISNYRSLAHLTLELVPQTDGSSTVGLIGLNEAGKSSILRAIALKDGLTQITPKDFLNKKDPVMILFKYHLNDLGMATLKEDLDEPETHLHPLAQEYLLNELVKITTNDRENVVFFATHSNYMIDKHDLSRNFRVTKNEICTEIERLDRKASTYASVTYEVFGIASSDYHNELYARLHQAFQDVDPTDEKRERIKVFDEQLFHATKKLQLDRPWKGAPNQCTLPTYIRNCIHHPDNGGTYSEQELRLSINAMRR